MPLFFERGRGAELVDVDGNVYLDYALGMGPNILGHAPPLVVRAVIESMKGGQLYAGQHRQELQLSHMIQGLFPSAELMRFGVSGSEMVQAAMRLARAFTKKPKVIKFEGHYHGWYDTVLVSTAPPLDAAGPDAAPYAHLPSAGQSKAAATDILVLPWNNLEVLADHIETSKHEIAAVIMEPILCNTGVILPAPGYLQSVRELCDRYGIVLIFDEVITGFRVGLRGAQGRLGVMPDLTVFAKALGGGFPIACLAGRKRIMELAAASVIHGGTFNSNVVSTSAAIATLKELSRAGGRLYQRMEKHGERLMSGLRDAGREVGLPMLVQGVGAAFNTAFAHEPVIDYRSYQRCDARMQSAFLWELQERGIRPTRRGTWFLSTAHTAADIDATINAAADALAAISAKHAT